MQVIITHGTLARTRVLHFNRWQLAASVAMLTLAILLVAATLYHLRPAEGRTRRLAVEQPARAIARGATIRATRSIHAREPRRDGAARRRDAGQARQARGDERACVGHGRRQGRGPEAVAGPRGCRRAGWPVRADAPTPSRSTTQPRRQCARGCDRPAHDLFTLHRIAAVRRAPASA